MGGIKKEYSSEKGNKVNLIGAKFFFFCFFFLLLKYLDAILTNSVLCSSTMENLFESTMVTVLTNDYQYNFEFGFFMFHNKKKPDSLLFTLYFTIQTIKIRNHFG
jgi:hypothetical protein